MKDYLLELLRRDAYHKGKFALSSGNTRQHYINCKPVTLSGEGLLIVSSLLLDYIETDTVSVAGLTIGADPIVSGVAFKSHTEKGRTINALIVRKEPKGRGINTWIEGPLPPQGSKITVLEDVITTGKSAIKAVEKLRDIGYRVDRVVSIVDRQEDKEADIAMSNANLELYSLFTLKDILGKQILKEEFPEKR